MITLRSERYRNARVTPRNAGGGVLRGAPYVVGPRNTLRKRYETLRNTHQEWPAEVATSTPRATAQAELATPAPQAAAEGGEVGE